MPCRAHQPSPVTARRAHGCPQAYRATLTVHLSHTGCCGTGCKQLHEGQLLDRHSRRHGVLRPLHCHWLLATGGEKALVIRAQEDLQSEHRKQAPLPPSLPAWRAVRMAASSYYLACRLIQYKKGLETHVLGCLLWMRGTTRPCTLPLFAGHCGAQVRHSRLLESTCGNAPSHSNADVQNCEWAGDMQCVRTVHLTHNLRRLAAAARCGSRGG